MTIDNYEDLGQKWNIFAKNNTLSYQQNANEGHVPGT